MERWRVRIWADRVGAFPDSPEFATYDEALAYVQAEQEWDEKHATHLDMTYTIEEVV